MSPAPPEYKTHIYPMAQLSALKFDPDFDCSPSRQPQQDAQARAARVTEGEREMQLAVVQIKAARAAQAAQTAHMWTVCKVMNMTFLAARSAGCARTMDTGHRIVQRRVRRIETRGTENRRGEGG